MIKNDHQYRTTKSWVEKFQQSIISLYRNEEKKQKDLDGWKLILDSYFSQIQNLLDEISEYEYLINHNYKKPLILSNSDVRLDDIGRILIKVRIAKKITEKELAILTKLTEEQIKECEQKDYQNASFDTVIEIAEALGVKLQHCVVVAETNDLVNEELIKIRQAQHTDRVSQVKG